MLIQKLFVYFFKKVFKLHWLKFNIFSSKKYQKYLFKKNSF